MTMQVNTLNNSKHSMEDAGSQMNSLQRFAYILISFTECYAADFCNLSYQFNTNFDYHYSSNLLNSCECSCFLVLGFLNEASRRWNTGLEKSYEEKNFFHYPNPKLLSLLVAFHYQLA